MSELFNNENVNKENSITACSSFSLTFQNANSKGDSISLASTFSQQTIFSIKLSIDTTRICTI